MADHPGANGTTKYDADMNMACYLCYERGKEVIYIPNSTQGYYCGPCLITAVFNGSLALGADVKTCDNCGDELEGSAVCHSCGSHDDCVDPEYAHDECYRSCYDCGDDYGSMQLLCDSCLDDRIASVGTNECRHCGDTVYCIDCDTDLLADALNNNDPAQRVLLSLLDRPVQAVAAQPTMTTEDGKTFRADDGVVIDWGEA